MRSRVQAFDWSRTPLGPRTQWSAALRVAVDVCLCSRFPMFVWWGDQLINIYNDAYIPILGMRHPAALGRPAQETWADIWADVGPQAEAVMVRGEATWNERVLLVMERKGYREDTYFTWSYSPIRDEDGQIAGLFCACTEETARVYAEAERDRLAAQRQLALDAAGMGWWHLDPQRNVTTFDRRFAEIFELDGPSRPNIDTLNVIHPDDLPMVNAKVVAALDPTNPQPYAAEYRIRRQDGSVRWIEANGIASFEGVGAERRAVSFVGTVADVSVRRREADRSKTILESITDAFFAVDSTWTFTYLNRQAERVLGERSQDLLGRVVWDAYPRLIGTPFEQTYRAAMNDRIAGAVTAYYAEHDRWYEVHAYPAPDGGISVYFRDATERKEAEELLSAQNRALEAVAGPAPLPEVLTTLAQILEDQSDGQSVATLMILDAERAHLVTGAAPSLPPEYNALFDGIAAVAGLGTCPDAAARNDITITPDIASAPSWAGHTHHPLNLGLKAVWSAPIRSSEGKVLGTFGAYFRECREPSPRERQVMEGLCRAAALAIERREAETARRLSEGRLRLTADAIPALIAYVDGEERYQFVNAAYFDWFGTTVDRVVGRTVRDVVGDVVYQERLPWIRQALAGNVVRFDYAMPHQTLGIRQTETSYVPDFADDGSVRGFVVLVYDITDRKAAEREREWLLASERAARSEAERASRLKDEFLATVSHELRTPLNAILGYAQVLRHGLRDPDSLEGLKVIERNARAQAQIIEDILDMSRVISGKLRLEVRRVDLAEVIDAALETVRPAAEAKGIHLSADIDRQTGPVSGDPSRLQQVVWNLLSNAIKFTPRGGIVQVRLAGITSHVEVAVKDTGQGIRPDFLPHVFEKFRQADATTTRKHGGLGLGLSIAKSLVEMHGGAIRADSAGEGRGSTFTITLPLRTETDPPSASAASRSSPAPAKPDRPSLADVVVLAVDDEADAREVVRRLLEESGARVFTAASAREALDVLDQRKVDVLLSDIGMAETDGYQLLQAVRRRPADRGGTVAAAALTAFARSEDRTRALLAGFQTHIAKPIESMELIAAVASLARIGRTPT